MEIEIQIPDELPVMTLPNVAFFPQALLPLHIFEPRYQAMLRDVLATDRLFAVAGLDSGKAEDPTSFEPPHAVAGVGLVRACQKNDDGTSNLLLQGLCRVKIASIVSDEPYRKIRVRALSSEPGAPLSENIKLRKELARMIQLKLKLSSLGGKSMSDFLRTVEDPETFVDIAAFSLCDNNTLKQKLLETLDVNRRLGMLLQEVRLEIESIKLQRKMQGGLSEDDISLN